MGRENSINFYINCRLELGPHRFSLNHLFYFQFLINILFSEIIILLQFHYLSMSLDSHFGELLLVSSKPFPWIYASVLIDLTGFSKRQYDVNYTYSLALNININCYLIVIIIGCYNIDNYLCFFIYVIIRSEHCVTYE